jgi:hypothetical protein
MTEHKICPFILAGLFTKDYTDGVRFAIAGCLKDKCAMWRIIREPYDRRTTQDEIISYCGLAGKP